MSCLVNRSELWIHMMKMTKINLLLTNSKLTSKLVNRHDYQRLAGIFALGFASGLPFLLTLSTLSFWLAEVGVSKTLVGLFMFVSLPYSLKFLWAPLVDAFHPPFLQRWLGMRRGWALFSQLGLMVSLWLLSYSNPMENIWYTALMACLVSFFSATQDIVIDAYRIEVLKGAHVGMGAAFETIGFRFGMLTSGAGALYLASLYSWQDAYQIMAVAVLLGTLAIFVMPEKPNLRLVSVQKKHQRYFAPWKTILQSQNLLLLTLFILTFKTADTVLNAMSAPFLVDLGFSKLEFANITKVFGITLMIVGGLFGGFLMQHQSILSALTTCIVLQVVSCLMFVIQAVVGHDNYVLSITIGVESFCSGLTSAALIAYLSTFCRHPFTATHFTVLYSIGSISRVFVSAGAGWLADHVSWPNLFLLAAVTAIPAGASLLLLEKRRNASSAHEQQLDKVTA